MTKQQPTKRRRRIRPSYAQHSDATIQADIQARCPQGSPFFDWLTEIRLDEIPVGGSGEFERGVFEGMRRLARMIQDYVMAQEVEKK